MSSLHRGAYLYEDEEDEDDDQQSPPVQEKGLDEDKTREKMKLLRTKMENMTVSKKVCLLSIFRIASASTKCARR